MGVTLSYRSTKKITPKQLKEILALAKKTGGKFDWWSEGLWISDKLDAGRAIGAQKVFCMIDDEDTDTWMAYLDTRETIRILSEIAAKLGVDWQLEFEGNPYGEISESGPDEILSANLEMLLELFPGDFKKLRKTPREKILKKWADR